MVHSSLTEIPAKTGGASAFTASANASPQAPGHCDDWPHVLRTLQILLSSFHPLANTILLSLHVSRPAGPNLVLYPIDSFFLNPVS